MCGETITYYNRNADEFFETTVAVDFKICQDRFIKHLGKIPKVILDFGCGSGRDSKYFLELGYQVEAVDGSEEMCKKASEYLGVSVKQMMFQDFSESEVYDGIWACASILHLPYDKLEQVFIEMEKSLKEEGIIYASFKYGDFEGHRKGRYFIDMTVEKMELLLKEKSHMELVESWVTPDVREDRENEKWLNVILKKK